MIITLTIAIGAGAAGPAAAKKAREVAKARRASGGEGLRRMLGELVKSTIIGVLHGLGLLVMALAGAGGRAAGHGVKLGAREARARWTERHARRAIAAANADPDTGPVAVREHTRDGHIVQAHTRSAPGRTGKHDTEPPGYHDMTDRRFYPWQPGDPQTRRQIMAGWRLRGQFGDGALRRARMEPGDRTTDFRSHLAARGRGDQ